MNKFAKEMLIDEITRFIDAEPENTEKFGRPFTLGHAIGMLKGIRTILEDDLKETNSKPRTNET